MALSIHTNYSSLTTQNQLNRTNSSLSTSMERLGTGLRINSAKDDAAGLQMATRLMAQSNGMAVGSRNASDAISMMQTAEGAMDEMTNITQRMKDLATQGANGTATSADRAAIGSEMVELQNELGNIMSNTSYGGNALFGASGKFGAGGVTFQIGESSAETLTVDASGNLKAMSGSLGTMTTALGMSAGGGSNITSAANALSSGAFRGMIDTLGSQLDTIGAVRSQFGANINRLEHTQNNLANMKENTDLARGRIMDADFAAETTNKTKQEMLMQAGMTVLGSANQMTGMVSSLMR
ncbi:MAG: lateral flagellin LafA [Shewanella sp.]|uniref:lateral flagellin LafA n=1 Tax=Shewanella sp. TaxID=50422 RepID=UPI003F3E7DB4